MAAPAPLPSGSVVNDDTVPAPPLVIGKPKRYDAQEIEKRKTKRKFIEEASKLIISDGAVEGYLKEIQSLIYNEDDKENVVGLFQVIPLGVIHLCYKFCREFKDYLLLLYGKQSGYGYNHKVNKEEDGTSEIKMLSMKQFTNSYGYRLEKVRKHLITIKPDKYVADNFGPYSQSKHRLNCFIPHLYLSKTVKKEMNLDLNERNVQSGIFRKTNIVNSDRLELLYFNSPYYYRYETDDTSNIYKYHRYPLQYVDKKVSTMENESKSNDDNLNSKLQDITRKKDSELQNTYYIPNNNQLLQFGPEYIKVLDIYNLKWLNNKQDYGVIKLSKKRYSPSMCMMGDRLFITGGRKKAYTPIVDTVEVLDCTKIKEIDWDKKIENVQFALSSIPLNSKMNYPRENHGCDAMNAKGGMIVVGGGSDRNWNPPTADTIEMYDHHKDKWTLSSAKTKYQYDNAKVWCSGNLIFITKIDLATIGSMGRIEYLDIRDNDNKWDVVDNRNIEKLYDLFPVKHKWNHFYQGLFI